MKKMKAPFVLVLVCLSLTSCELLETPVTCEGFGYLTVTNGSLNTIHKIMIDGTWYRTLAPGESETIELAAGRYDMQFKGDGQGGCSPSTATISACKTEGRVCRN
ncbi:MAG: hypothetical protein HUU01_18925 [Saprospiraceae bacterium]|nr:hypothetical protein [Saprospiraceae bacterium]